MVILRVKLPHQHLKLEGKFRFLRPHLVPQPLADSSRDHLAGLRVNPVGAFGGSVGHFGCVSLRARVGLSLLIQSEAKLLWVLSPRAVNCFGVCLPDAGSSSLKIVADVEIRHSTAGVFDIEQAWDGAARIISISRCSGGCPLARISEDRRLLPRSLFHNAGEAPSNGPSSRPRRPPVLP